MSGDRRRAMLGSFSVMALTLMACNLPAFSAGPREPSPGKKVLIVWGGWAGHEPKQCVDVFAPWLAEQPLMRQGSPCDA